MMVMANSMRLTSGLLVYVSCTLLLVLIGLPSSRTFSLFHWGSSKDNPGESCVPIPEPDVCRNICELAVSKGYPCEEYSTPTEDGFYLAVHRIRHGRKRASKNKTKKLPPVFLQHGLLCSAFDWVSNMENQSLGFLLADQGFDVWMGNVRGNTYSRSHVKYTPDDKEFWDWSWDEMAKYDLPAMLGLVLNETKEEQLYYVGHSQGTLLGFSAFSSNQELAKKVKSFFALGPVSTVGHIKGPFKALAYITPEIRDLFYLLGVKEFLPSSELMNILGSSFCEIFTKFLCSDFLFVICGADPQQFNQTRLPVYIGHTPAGTSVKNMVHFAQMTRSGKFQMYDYGSSVDNILHYGQETAPLYNATDVNVPVYLYSAGKDILADPEDVKTLTSLLPNVQTAQIIPEWNHLDFVWGLDARKVIYESIIGVMKNETTVAKPVRSNRIE